MFIEQLPRLVAPRGSITVRAIGWAIGQLRREHGTIAGLARQLGTSWKTLWRAIRPELERLAADESRFDGVTSLGVDEHVWHHVDRRARGPRELTGMVDLTRDSHGRVRARLLDLVPGRSGKALLWHKPRHLAGNTHRDHRVSPHSLHRLLSRSTLLPPTLGARGSNRVRVSPR